MYVLYASHAGAGSASSDAVGGAADPAAAWRSRRVDVPVPSCRPPHARVWGGVGGVGGARARRLPRWVGATRKNSAPVPDAWLACGEGGSSSQKVPRPKAILPRNMAGAQTCLWYVRVAPFR